MFTTKNLLILVVRNALISLVAILLTIIAIFFLKNKIENITNTIAQNHKLEAEFKKRVELFSVLNHDSEIIGGNETLIDNAFISSDNISEFINTLDKLATDNKVTQVYHFGSPVPTTNIEPYPISSISYSTEVTADISTISNYLKGFENLPYFTKIEGFDISSQNKNGWTGGATISTRSTLLTKSVQ